MELGVLGPLQVRQDGAPVPIPGAKPRAILTMLGLHGGSVVPAETLIELLWGDDPPRTAAKALQTHISSLRRTLGDGFVLTEGTGWTLSTTEIDASRYKLATKRGRDAAAAGDNTQAVARFEEALTLWRGIPELPDSHRGVSEKTRWIESHAALVEDRADALLATGRAAEIVGELEAAVADAPLRERRWGQLMLALYRAGRQGEALAAYQRARSLLADELGVDPGPELRRLEAAVVAQDTALDAPVAQQLQSVMRAVTFLLTDIEGSTAAWEADAGAMAAALARHDELVEQVVTSRGGRLIKTRGEGDATFSVFERPSAAAAAAIELQDAILHEPWALREPMRIRVALHTGEVELRDGDYFGRAVNRAARLRSLANGGQILCSGATAELVIDSLPDDVLLADLGMRQLKNLARPEHVFELRLETTELPEEPSEAPIERPDLPAILTGPGPFVGRGDELERLLSAWQTALTGSTRAVLIAGEPGVGKTRLAGEWSRQAYQQGAVVLYGRCDEDLGAPYQPFAEALRSLMPCLGASRLRGLRGVEALLPLAPGLSDVIPDLATPTRADPDTERYALFDAVVALLQLTSTSAPVVLILDDLHWAAKPTLLLLRHLLRFGDQARVQIVGTYRSTDLDRSHPLAAMLADLHRDGTANRLALSGLDEDDVSAYVAEAGYDDEELARALASVTGGNPFFLIEALRHVDESGGVWDPSTLPQGVREAVSRRLSRLPAETNKALAAAAVVGSRFSLDLVERVVDQDLVDAFDEACKAGIVIEEPGGRYRFNHAIVRQSLLAELASVRRMRLHQRIATTLENEPGADDELLAELAHHYFECAWAGNAAKAVLYCRRAADQAMARLGYEGAADLYDHALHALEEIDEELPDRDEQTAELLIARCEALLAAGDVASAAGAVAQLQEATVDSARLTAWATCFDGQLSMLIHPERLDEVAAAVGAAAEKLAELDDAAGEAQAHTVRAGCLARLGRVGDCEIALDEALTAARRAREHRRVNAVLAGAPLAALWGPNPVPRAGGRCLDVVRLLRITTDSPAVEATSTRCQAVLEAFRGRAEAARRMIDSARRTVTELGLRHALLEVEQFAGIVELVVDDPAAAEPHLRKAYNGFRRMGLDADTAETAALLGRACLTLGRDAEPDELCSESERLAGHALKASISWRTLRAQLLSRRGDHKEARRVAEAAVALAERTDALVDHGDACLALATVLGAAGDAVGARGAAQRAADLYERKGAAALTEKAHRMLGEGDVPTAPAPSATPIVELTNACVRAGERVETAVNRGAWDEFEQLFAPQTSVESRRKIIGFTPTDIPFGDWPHQHRLVLETGGVRISHVVVAVRGERLALNRLAVGTADSSPGAPHDEFLQIYGINEEGLITLQVWFDVEDLDAAIAELDAMHARFEQERPSAQRFGNALSRAAERISSCYAARDWDAMAYLLAEDLIVDDRRRTVNAGIRHGRDAAIEDLRRSAEVGFTNMTPAVVATRGRRLSLNRFSTHDQRPEEFGAEALHVAEFDADDRLAALVVFDPDEFDAAITELDARYLAGDAAAHAHTWSAITAAYAAVNRREVPATTQGFASIDHRRGAAVPPGGIIAYIQAAWDDLADSKIYIETVHRLNSFGAVISHAAHGISQEGLDAEWRMICIFTVEGDALSRCELFDEADLDAALARFDELSQPRRQPENAATRVDKRFQECFAARDWDAMAEMLSDGTSIEDRRRVVNAGNLHGRDAELTVHAYAAVGSQHVTATVTATRGQRLALSHYRFTGTDQRQDAFRIEILAVVEIDTDKRIAAVVVFDCDDIDAAFAELDARYLAGEAAPHSHTWQTVMDAVEELNRQEPGPMIRGLTYADHRQVPFATSTDYERGIEELWSLVPDARYRVTVVHALDAHGVVATLVIAGTDTHGNELQWARLISLVPSEARVEVYDEADLEAALATFDELCRPAPRLENAASQVSERFLAHFAAREWEVMPQLLAEDSFSDDRRSVVGVGIRRGPEVIIADWRAVAETGTKNVAFTVIATRGDRLVLASLRFAGHDQRPEAFRTDVLGIIEVNSENRIAACMMFDLDDADAAFEELDARYLTGEAAPHARGWSVISMAYAGMTRHELPPTTPDYANIDHRRFPMEAGAFNASLSAQWKLLPNFRLRIEAVHRLSNLGIVFTQAAKGTSHEGFDAEWRCAEIMTVDGDLINRCELFDEADLDTAIARFEELLPRPRRLENAVSRTHDRFLAYFTSRDWAAIAEILADDACTDDRRRVVNTGVRHGRDAVLAELSALADVGGISLTSEVIAIRGEHLALRRGRYMVSGQEEEYHLDALEIIETDADGRLVGRVAFDLTEIDAAFEELDARYLAGEAAAHAQTWSVVARSYYETNRRELPSMTPDSAFIDHRAVLTTEQEHLAAYLSSLWDLLPDISVYIEAVHRLSDLGGVVTQAARGTSREGFGAEWRAIAVSVLEGDLYSRVEAFDEADLDTALARFDELQTQTCHLENAASRANRRLFADSAVHNWAAIAKILADDSFVDDRRRVVSVGFWDGRDTVMANMRALVEGLANVTLTVLATRGERLALTRTCSWNGDPRDGEFGVELLGIVEIDADERIAGYVFFDPDDIDAAFEELDARYLAGEAAPHSRTWSVVTRDYATINRHEVPTTTSDWVNIDHRRGIAFAPGEFAQYLQATFDVASDIKIHIEAIHRLSDLGIVFTHAAYGSSQEGFDAEWRETAILTVDGDLVNRCEMFDESDVEAALARFAELSPSDGLLSL
ncbi:hypothetical protein A5707_10730 [Mycobacterium kyorinense]|uniref:Cyclase n=1 Tax=Mycobacterium kyorinense TaxID=487514 RepID=A0A1A2YQ68_9MYCO|nr:BTAD domain-containing putative transcriptional regulator [Mycobacterium kyorinense]OBI40150.1 hypothetical protein A5707_10730 [Mycobacterium kyorinense]